MKVWKYVMPERDCRIEVPKGARILSCQMQAQRFCLWFLIDEDQEETESRRFVAVWTGRDIPFADLMYLATVQSDGIVHHVFEIFECPVRQHGVKPRAAHCYVR